MKRNTNLFLSFLFFLIFHSLLTAQVQWNPDAGYLPSLSNSAVITASSGTMPERAIDGDLTTPWKSSNPLPVGYLSRSEENVFLSNPNFSITSSGVTNFNVVRDGSLNNSNVIIPNSNGQSTVEINFPINQHLIYFSMKASANVDIHIFGFTTSGDSTLIATHPLGTLEAVGYDISGTFTKLKLHASQAFQLYEFGGLTAPPKEHVTIDLGQQYVINNIKTKHWAGINTAIGTRLCISNDGLNWTEAAMLDPFSLDLSQTFLPRETEARFIRLEHLVNMKTQDGVFIFEIEVNTDNGKFGPPLPATMSTHKMKDIIGVNTVWGWGRPTSTNNLPDGKGPKLHNKYATHARNYHFMNWDIADPDHPVDYSQMATGCPSPICADCVLLDCWLDWDVEYQAWVDAGLKVQASLQFDLFFNMGLWWEDQWDSPYNSAYAYGKAFAEHFGPTQGNGLVETVEVGNEPWYYDAAIYREILRGMAKGVKDADPAMEVFPCALQAYNPNVELPSPHLQFRNYMGTRITEAEAPFLDGINIHNYSFVNTTSGERIAVHPEHPGSEFNGIRNAVRFRDHNMPGKKILLSEWGWDAPSANEECTHSECVSEDAAVAYITRAAMIAHRSNLDRATYFFYANEDKPSSLFSRSGLTESINNDFKPKKTFVALETLIGTLGDYHFLNAYQEDESAYIYEFGNADGTVTHVAAWLPIDGDLNTSTTVSYASNQIPGNTILINGDDPGGKSIPTPNYSTGNIDLVLGVNPIVVELGTSCPPPTTACEDGDPNTINDVHDGNCNCTGTCPPAGTYCDDGNPNTVDDMYDEACVCAGMSFGEGCEFIVNGNFDNNINYWDSWGCKPVFNNRTINIRDIIVEDVAWDAVVYQGGFTLLQGEQYTVRFSAAATTNRTIGFKLGLAAPPHDYYYGKQNLAITTDMQEYSYTFIMNEPSTSDANMEFHVADSDAEIIIDNISVAPANCLTTPPDICEIIPNGFFDFNLNGWNSIACTPYYDNGKAKIANISENASEWSSRFVTNQFPVTGGREYTLSFKASALTNRTMSFRLGSTTTTYYYQHINLSPLTQNYTFTFTIHNADASEAALQFNVGGNTADISLDDVSLLPTDCGVVPEVECNIIENSMFDIDISGWGFWQCFLIWQNGVMNVSNINPGITPQDAVVYSPTFPLEQGQVYAIRFDASALSNRTIGIEVGATVYPFEDFFSTQANISTTMQSYLYTFTMTGSTTPRGNIRFNLGGDATALTLDNISIAPVNCGDILAQPACNIITNSSFNTNLNDWGQWGCSANFSNQKVWVSDITTGQYPWASAFGQYPFSLDADVAYEVTFDASAAASRPLSVKVGLGVAPWTSFLFQEVELKPFMQSFTLSFTMPHNNTNTASLDFLFGASPHEIWIDNVKLRKVGCVDFCLEHVQVSGVTTSGNYKAATSVNSNTIIPPGVNINFRAGQSVFLGAGFEVKGGTDFSADIEPCSND